MSRTDPVRLYQIIMSAIKTAKEYRTQERVWAKAKAKAKAKSEAEAMSKAKAEAEAETEAEAERGK